MRHTGQFYFPHRLRIKSQTKSQLKKILMPWASGPRKEEKSGAASSFASARFGLTWKVIYSQWLIRKLPQLVSQSDWTPHSTARKTTIGRSGLPNRRKLFFVTYYLSNLSIFVLFWLNQSRLGMPETGGAVENKVYVGTDIHAYYLSRRGVGNY